MAKKKNEIKNIISIDAYNNVSYGLRNQKINQIKKLTFDKANFISSFVANKETIVANVKISNSIPEEDVESILERRVYEELNLDETIEYNFKYIELTNKDDENERVFSIFVIEVSRLFTLFKDKIETIKYIDAIYPMALLYKPLYTNEIINGKDKTDVFFYITEEEASITVYKNGEYIYSKSIDYSFVSLYDKYCAAKGEKVDQNEFFKKIKEEGLKSSDQEFQQLLVRILGEMFVSINDIVIYIKRAFNISGIDNFYIGSSKGNIIGMDSYSNNYLGLESKEFNFDYGISSAYEIDSLHYLTLLNSKEMLSNTKYTIDFSIFPRPPSFKNRASGQFIISMGLGVSAALALPLYFLVSSYMNEAKIFGLNAKNLELSKTAGHYRQEIVSVQQKINVLNKNIERELEKYYSKVKTLDSIYNKKVNYKMKSGALFNLAEDIYDKDVKITQIDTADDFYFLTIVSKDDKKITDFINYLSNKYFKDIKSIDIKSIEQEPGADYYTGRLEIEFKSKGQKYDYTKFIELLTQDNKYYRNISRLDYLKEKDRGSEKVLLINRKPYKEISKKEYEDLSKKKEEKPAIKNITRHSNSGSSSFEVFSGHGVNVSRMGNKYYKGQGKNKVEISKAEFEREKSKYKSAFSKLSGGKK